MAFYTSIIAALLLTLQGFEGYTLTQEKTLSVTRGDTVKIACTQSAGSLSPPSLELMVAPQPPLPGLEGPTLVCLAKGFRPAGAALSWSEDGASVSGEEVRAGVAQRQSDGSYTLSSVLTLPTTRWRSAHTFTCHVSHSALSSPLTKSVSSQQCSL
ncbi:hypothetical protein NHX12_018977 [Muraenolepis orangiensis]|uniref:Ig-like domain-containing protein n=1 Tax=Muraenolepis orangiensis TaxID=630683 RepID=A0A9Q0ESG4_9TELE|nr:hypothetical protein NHX12_018977 [Muraenolepis orangiensis]